MKDRINEWIIILRHQLRSKIDELYKDRIEVINKRTFVYSAPFYIDYNQVRYTFEVHLNQREIYFYDNEFDEKNSLIYENAYYSIIDIYRGLNNLKTRTRHKITNILKKELCKKVEVHYGGQNFDHITFDFDNVSNDEFVIINDKKISLVKLLLILSLIQAKSNVFFEYMPSMKNGIIYLIVVLLAKKNNTVLLSKGWKYDSIRKYFVLNKMPTVLFIEIKDHNKNEILQMKEEIKQMKCNDGVEKFLLKYNENYGTTYDINSLYTTKVQKDIKELLVDNRMKTVFLRDKTGLTDYSVSELTSLKYSECSSMYNLESKKITGKKYIWLTIKTTRYEYYLTKEEMEDIIKIGI